MDMMYGGAGFILMMIIWFVMWYVGVLILRWVLGTNKMIQELKDQNNTLKEILNEMRKKD
ncbi:MAG: hypothetical protein ACRC54_04815 [Fusobacteriaceae bacterium]